MAEIPGGAAAGGIPGGNGASEQLGNIAKPGAEQAQGGGMPGAPGVPTPPDPSAPVKELNPAADPAGPGVGGDMSSSPQGEAPGPGAELDGDEADEKGKLAENAAKAAAIPAAGVAGQAMVIAMFLAWIKGMLAMVQALLANLWNILVAILMNVVHAVVGFFVSIGTSIAGALGLGATASAVTSVASFGLSLIMAVGALLTGSAMVDGAANVAQRDGAVIDCGPGAVQTVSDVKDSGTVDADANTLKNAETVYSVFKAWGMPDENIAGIIGNWDAESGVDPTSVEGIFTEPYTIGSRKQEKLATGSDGFGIGLGQWTFGRHTNLREYAKSHDVPWEKIETQMGYMLSAGEASDADIVRGMIKESKGTPSEAALYFHDKWERSADTASMAQRRANYAESWMGKFAGWEADQALADSILEQSGSTVEGANEASVETAASSCRSADVGSTVALSKGGLSLEEAQKLMDLYLKEGDAFLDGRYGGGGPGSCGDDHAMNCVSFSTYFANKYTEFQQYAPGNGVRTAFAMAEMLGKETSHTPVPYSVASGPGSGPAGHTWVVLGVTDTSVIVGEAGYCSNRGSVREMPLSEATSGKWTYVDLSDIMLPPDKVYKA